MLLDTDSFVIDPKLYGVPDLQQLRDYRIWDGHYHGIRPTRNLLKQHEQMMFYIRRMGIERVISVDIGGMLKEPIVPTVYDNDMRNLLEREKDHLSGIIRIDPGFPEKSCAKMKEWIEDGPCIGIKYVGGNQSGITCSHPNSDAIIRMAVEMKAVIYIHTWIKIGGSPRYPGGGNYSGESTPMDVAALAQRFPDVQMICGHSGGDWELGVKAIRPYENVLFEFSGGDANSGSVDLAIKELGVDRIVWGGHGPSRSFSTEISKVLDASVSDAGRVKIFGGNYRRLAADIFRRKGLSLEV